jgi:hypothetical protein
LKEGLLRRIEGLLVGRGQMGSRGVHTRASRSIGRRDGGGHIIHSAAQAAHHVTQLLLPLWVVRELEAPPRQRLAHGLHLPQRLFQLLVPGQQPQQLTHLVVEGGVDEEKGEHHSVGPVLPGGIHDEGEALALEHLGGPSFHGPQGSEPHSGPVIHRLQQPSHVHPALQGEELSGRGTGEEGSQQLLISPGGVVRPALRYGLAAAGGWALRGGGRCHGRGVTSPQPPSWSFFPSAGSGGGMGGVDLRLWLVAPRLARAEGFIRARWRRQRGTAR